MKIPGSIEYSSLVYGHSRVLAKMFSPRGNQVFQAEQTGLIQTFVEVALERAIPSASSLNLLGPKLLSILARDGIFNRDSDWPVIAFRNEGEIVRVIEWRGINAGFGSEVDGKSIPESQPRTERRARRLRSP
jgi:hypothetical protein